MDGARLRRCRPEQGEDAACWRKGKVKMHSLVDEPYRHSLCHPSESAW